MSLAGYVPIFKTHSASKAPIVVGDRRQLPITSRAAKPELHSRDGVPQVPGTGGKEQSPASKGGGDGSAPPPQLVTKSKTLSAAKSLEQTCGAIGGHLLGLNRRFGDSFKVVRCRRRPAGKALAVA